MLTGFMGFYDVAQIRDVYNSSEISHISLTVIVHFLIIFHTEFVDF
jgi:hypothetical protein